jgi:hypothetical protein
LSDQPDELEYELEDELDDKLEDELEDEVTTFFARRSFLTKAISFFNTDGLPIYSA